MSYLLLTDAEIESIKLDHKEYTMLNAAMEKYEPKVFSGLFFNEEAQKLIKMKIAKRQRALILSALKHLHEATSEPYAFGLRVRDLIQRMEAE